MLIQKFIIGETMKQQLQQYETDTIESIMDRGIPFTNKEREGYTEFEAFDPSTDTDIQGIHVHPHYDEDEQKWVPGELRIYLEGTIDRNISENAVTGDMEDTFLRYMAERILRYQERVLKNFQKLREQHPEVSW